MSWLTKRPASDCLASCHDRWWKRTWISRIALISLLPDDMECTVYNVKFRVYSVQFTVYSVQCAVYVVQGTAYSVQWTVYSIQCTVYSVQCTVYSIQSTVYTYHWSLYTLHWSAVFRTTNWDGWTETISPQVARTNLDLKYLPINGLTHTVLSCVLIKTVLFFSPLKLIYIYDGISMELKLIANLLEIFVICTQIYPPGFCLDDGLRAWRILGTNGSTNTG